MSKNPFNNGICCPANSRAVGGGCDCNADYTLAFRKSVGYCAACPSNSTSSPGGNCACNPGYTAYDYGTGMTTSGTGLYCTACPANATATGGAACVCEAGFFASGSGTSLTCSVCPANASVSGGACACNPGYVAIGSGSSLSCLKCPANSTLYYSAATTSGFCACNPGYTGVFNGGSLQCVQCSANQVVSQGNCAASCPAGQVVVNGQCACPLGQAMRNGICACSGGQTGTAPSCQCPANQGLDLTTGQCASCAGPNQTIQNNQCLLCYNYGGTCHPCAPNQCVSNNIGNYNVAQCAGSDNIDPSRPGNPECGWCPSGTFANAQDECVSVACPGGMVWQNSQCVCPAGESLNSQGQCSCYSGQCDDRNTGSCVPDPANGVSPQDPTQDCACPSGFEFQSSGSPGQAGKCVIICSNGEVPDVTGTSCACPQGDVIAPAGPQQGSCVNPANYCCQDVGGAAWGQTGGFTGCVELGGDGPAPAGCGYCKGVGGCH